MGATVVVKKRTKFNNLYAVIVDITLDSSYPAGGEAITPQQLGLTTIDFVLPSPAAGYLPEFDHTTKKLKMFTPTTSHAHQQQIKTGATAAADSTSGAKIVDSAAAETDVVAMGTAISTTYDIGDTVDNDASAASEVAATTDLSAVTVRVLAMGL